MFLRSECLLCFLVLSSGYRRRVIAERLLAAMLEEMPAGRDVTVKTYRKGVPEGEAARVFYRRVGFVDERLTEEFSAPVQEFVLKRQAIAILETGV